MSSLLTTVTPAVDLADAPRVHLRLFPDDKSRRGPGVQVTVETGMAALTFYPSADGLDELAGALSEAAVALRAARVPA